MLLREAGKREKGDFLQCFPYYFLPEQIPNDFFSDRENWKKERGSRWTATVFRDGLGRQLPVNSASEDLSP